MKSFETLSDEELLIKLKLEKTEREAFVELYNRYWFRLFSAACKRLGQDETAEEIVQNFFTDLWTRRKEIDITLSFESYALTSIRYQVINYWKKELVRERYQEDLEGSVDFNTSTEDYINFREAQKLLEYEITQMSPKCRAVYELSRNKNKNNREIAMELGISEKTVENHLTKALKKLRITLDALMSVWVLF